MSGPIRINALAADLADGRTDWVPEVPVLYQGDREANILRFLLRNGGAPVDAAGYTASLSVLRPDGLLAACPAVQGPEGLEAALPGPCYDLAGNLGCVLRLADAQGIVTVISFTLTVRAPADGAASAVTGGEILRLSDLIALQAALEVLRDTGLRIQGVAETAGDLAGRAGEAGQAYLVGDTLHVWTGVAWTPGPRLQGRDGAGAYDLARAEGFAGTRAEWLASLRGRDGAAGADGAAGRDGRDLTGETVFESLPTHAKTLPGAVGELYGLLGGVSDALEAILGPEGGGEA